MEIRNVGTGLEVYREITNTDTVDSFYNSILVCFEENAPESTAGWDIEEIAEINAGYEFVFRTENGIETVFRLGGNKLLDVTRDLGIRLTEEQLNTLKTYFEFAK